MRPIENRDWHSSSLRSRLGLPQWRGEPFLEAMERYQLMFDDRGRLDRNAVTGGMWLRVGTAAAFMLVGGITAAFNGEVTAAQAFAIALGCAAACALAWRRAWKVLNGADAASVASASQTPQSSPPAAAY
jgi:hypothetical protein